MSFKATAQSDDIVPPRRYVASTISGVWVQAVDSTARSYAISALPLGGKPIVNTGQIDHVYVTLLCETADVYFAFGAATAATLDDTAVNAAGVALLASTAMLPTMPFRLVRDIPMSFRIQRSVDSFLQLKCASGSTATLRVYASSQAEG